MEQQHKREISELQMQTVLNSVSVRQPDYATSITANTLLLANCPEVNLEKETKAPNSMAAKRRARLVP